MLLSVWMHTDHNNPEINYIRQIRTVGRRIPLWQEVPFGLAG